MRQACSASARCAFVITKAQRARRDRGRDFVRSFKCDVKNAKIAESAKERMRGASCHPEVLRRIWHRCHPLLVAPPMSPNVPARPRQMSRSVPGCPLMSPKSRRRKTNPLPDHHHADRYTVLPPCNAVLRPVIEIVVAQHEPTAP